MTLRLKKILTFNVLGFLSAAVFIAAATGSSSASATGQADSDTRLHTATASLVMLYSVKNNICILLQGTSNPAFATRSAGKVTALQAALAELTAVDARKPAPQALAAQIKRLDRDWTAFSPVLNQIAQGDVHAVPVGQFLVMQNQVHAALEDVRRTLERQSGLATTAQDKWLSQVMDQKARIRQLANSACLAQHEVTAMQSRAAMLRLKQEFVRTLKGSMTAKLTGPARLDLDKVTASWSEFDALLDEMTTQPATRTQAALHLAALGDKITGQLGLLENARTENTFMKHFTRPDQ